MKPFSLKEVIEFNPNCIICNKPLTIFYNFYISYQDTPEACSPGLGDHRSHLRLNGDTLEDLKYWNFGLDSSIRKNEALFNKTLSAFKKPVIFKKCRTCQHGISFEVDYAHNKRYDSFPPLLFSREMLQFNLTRSIEVLVKREISTEFCAGLHLFSNPGGIELYRTGLTNFEFSNAGFKILKRKAKMLITFM